MTHLILRFLVVFGLFLPSPSMVSAQGSQQVITHISGVEFEGDTFWTSNVFGPPNPNSSSPIQVIDDGLRRIFVNRDSIASVGESSRRETEFDIPQKVYLGNTKGFGNLVYAGPFDENGHRHIRVNDGRVIQDIVQGITKITPRWCQLEALSNPESNKMRTYSMRVATASIPRTVLKKLLRSTIERGNIKSHLEIVEFFLQSRDFTDAMQELSLIQALYPGQIDSIRDGRRVVRQAHARLYKQQIEARIDNGQPELANQMIDVFDDNGVAERFLSRSLNSKSELIAGEKTLRM